jgi:extradiol dioxygenase family protein
VTTPVLHLSLPVSNLEETTAFYGGTLGCRLGRIRDTWIDVWFYGMQLTLHQRPGEVLVREQQGVRHFGVTLDRTDFTELVSRLEAAEVDWVTRPTTHADEQLSGKTNVKLRDPSGHVIEVKYYPEGAGLAPEAETPS